MLAAFARSRLSSSPSSLRAFSRGAKSAAPVKGKAWALDVLKDAAGVTGKQAELAYDALLSGIAERVAAGERVTFQGFGTFERVARAAREGRNPSTGAALKIPATNAPKFKAGAAFKQAVKMG